MPLTCPSCQTTLESLTVADIALSWCAEGCRGIWFDSQELAQLNESTSIDSLKTIFPQAQNTATQAVAPPPGRLCPIDGTVMHHYQWNLTSGIYLDSCKACRGIWLDAGEVNAFFDGVAQAREPKEIPDELRWKMAANDVQVSREVGAMEKTATKTAISWDIGPLDNLMRALVGLVLPD